MQSIKSKIILWMIRNRHLFQFKLKPEVVDETFSVQKFRDSVDKATARNKMPIDVRAEKMKINEMYAEWIVPEQYPEEKVLLYIHGGGFISGGCSSHRTYVAKFAKECNLKSLVFDYRLAPEHPFPAALDDCVEAYSWLLNQGYTPENIAVGGESAGATYVLSLLLALKEKKIALPKVAFSISPVTDLRCQGASFQYNLKHDIAPAGSSEFWAKLYYGESDPTNPLVSPQFGDFTGLPPIYICVGTHEIHLDDCLSVAKKAKDQGVDVTLGKWENMVHAFPLMTPMFPEATEAFVEICTYVKKHLEK